MNYREKILLDINKLPAISTAATQLASAMNDPDLDIQRVVRIIQYDPGITTNVLRLANSSYFRGSSSSIDSIQQAVVRLGLNRLFDLIVMSSTHSILDKPIAGYNLPPGELWLHSVAVAVTARNIADSLQILDRSTAFTAGLLHDVGKIVIGSFIEKNFDKIDNIAKDSDLSFEIAEREILGTDHAEIGATILDLWKFPDTIVTSVRFHHTPEAVHGSMPVVDAVHISDILCVMMGIGSGREGLQHKVSEEIISRYSLTPSILEMVISHSFDDMHKFADFFSISGGGTRYGI